MTATRRFWTLNNIQNVMVAWHGGPSFLPNHLLINVEHAAQVSQVVSTTLTSVSLPASVNSAGLRTYDTDKDTGRSEMVPTRPLWDPETSRGLGFSYPIVEPRRSKCSVFWRSYGPGEDRRGLVSYTIYIIFYSLTLGIIGRLSLLPVSISWRAAQQP